MSTQPSPALLVTAALAAATGDPDTANALLLEHPSLSDPIVLAASMLGLAGAIARGYYGGPLVVNDITGAPSDAGDAAISQIADAVWAEEPARAIELYRAHVVTLSRAGAQAWAGMLIGFATASLLNVWQGNATELTVPTLPVE